MLPTILSSTNLSLLKQVARFAERRQEVLAGNVANLDTPGYRQRDLPVGEFRQALKDAVAHSQPKPRSPGEALGMLQTPVSPGDVRPTLDAFFPDTLFQAQTSREQPGITSNDANNRSVEQQFLEMTKNSLLQQFAVQVLQKQYDQLQTVISEHV